MLISALIKVMCKVIFLASYMLYNTRCIISSDFSSFSLPRFCKWCVRGQYSGLQVFKRINVIWQWLQKHSPYHSWISGHLSIDNRGHITNYLYSHIFKEYSVCESTTSQKIYDVGSFCVCAINYAYSVIFGKILPRS